MRRMSAMAKTLFGFIHIPEESDGKGGFIPAHIRLSNTTFRLHVANGVEMEKHLHLSASGEIRHDYTLYHFTDHSSSDLMKTIEILTSPTPQANIIYERELFVGAVRMGDDRFLQLKEGPRFMQVEIGSAFRFSLAEFVIYQVPELREVLARKLPRRMHAA